MADETTTETVIENSQESNNDFLSFSDAEDNNLHEDESSEKEKEGEVKDFTDFDDEQEKKEVEDTKSEPVVKEEKKESEVKEENNEEVKIISASFDDKEVKIAANTIFKSKVDGKEEEVTIQELLNNYSGEKSAARRFSDLDNSKKLWLSEKDELMSDVNTFTEAVKKQDGDGAIQALATLTGSNPLELRNKFKDLLVSQVKTYLELSSEEQKEFDINKEREYYKQEREYQNQQNEIKQSKSELETQIFRFMTKNGISDQGIVDLYDDAQAKSIELNNIKDFESFYVEKLSHDKSLDILSKVEPSLSKNTENVKIVSDFMKGNPDLKDDEVISMIKEVILEEQESSINSKVKARGEKNKKTKSSTSTKQSENFDDDELLTFDDISIY